MAITIHNTSVAGWGSVNTSVTVSKNTGLAVGDLMVAQVVTIIDNSGDVINTPSGWTKIGSEVKLNTSGSTYLHQTLFWKIADSGDTAASNFTFTFTSSTFFNAAIYRVSGMNTVNPIDQNASGTVADNANFSASGFTPTYGDEAYIIFGANFNGNGTASSYAIATDNPTWNEDYESSSSGNRCIVGASAIRSASTATGSFSFSGVGAGNDTVGHMIAIKTIVDVTVSPSVLTSTSTLQAPTISGGASVSVSTLTATSEVKTPTEIGRADWSTQDKSDTGTWSVLNKS
jgi:hypothetical protein